MLEQLKKEVYEANLALFKEKLAIHTWGNASSIDRNLCLVVIKPSGVDYNIMKPENMVVVNLDGKIVDGNYKPSSDTATHLELYKSFNGIGGIAHTHSQWATSWAQAQRSIPCYGTTHADCFFGEIPCTRDLLELEVEENYEINTGRIIIEAFRDKDPLNIPGILCSRHGPFTWGKNVKDAIYNASVLEECAKIAYYTEKLNKNISKLPQYLINKHYTRKHGPKSYYGQD